MLAIFVFDVSFDLLLKMFTFAIDAQVWQSSTLIESQKCSTGFLIAFSVRSQISERQLCECVCVCVNGDTINLGAKCMSEMLF
jgi:hypothetical protein